MERKSRARSSSSSKRASAPPKVVAVLAGLLERAATRGDADGSSSAAAFRSPGGRKPEIGVRRYAERIYRYAGCSPACFVVAYAYLDRLAAPAPEEGEGEVVAVDSYSVHRLLITSVMVATKFMDDIHYNNAYFARVGGVEVSEMNGLELEFLFALRFRLNVTPDEFASYCGTLEGQMTTTTTPSLSPTQLLMISPEEEESRRQEQGKVDAAAMAGITTFTVARLSVVEITQ
ncbi:cyclin-P4-1 [Lolium perenne]|uniref:cyclin-P4-1 n=1 Tax=Lolium perenne TaxID=4522 RepID=UPI0021EAB63F|nr:cyclin-P4-1-like [Lolium perenne]